MKLKSSVLAGGYPLGSYVRTCDNISYSNGILSASCRAPYGMTFGSSLKVPESYSDIVNCSGSLTLDHC